MNVVSFMSNMRVVRFTREVSVVIDVKGMSVHSRDVNNNTSSSIIKLRYRIVSISKRKRLKS